MAEAINFLSDVSPSSLTPWNSCRLKALLRGAGEVHAYMVHVGVGWVWARSSVLRAWKRPSMEACLDGNLRWLAFDGWGFHEGFFHWRKYLSGREAN